MSDPPSQDLFANSRRLLGPNRFFPGPGAVLDALPPAGFDQAAIERWRANVAGLRAKLGWPNQTLAVRRHAGGTTLAVEAPEDQLQAACDVNEIAWEAAADGSALEDPVLIDRVAKDAAEEKEPALRALLETAAARGLPVFLDEDEVTIGVGQKGHSWLREALPTPDEIPWDTLGGAPSIVVTGTNGKTTTVRLCARIAGAAGYRAGYNCTEGVVVDGVLVVSGDYAGPAGARRVIRHAGVTFAVLEAARGGILRRGLAIRQADVAVVTNVTPDHFGEYGVDTIEDLTETKLVVARLLDEQGLLVVNAEGASLLAAARRLEKRLGLFALDYDHPELAAHRAGGGATCGVSAGRMRLSGDGKEHDLGAVAAMPLTVGGAARFNIANIAAASLACAACGIAPDVIAGELARFGARREDNSGRLERWKLRGVEILLDYAHNPDGLDGLLAVAESLRRPGSRLGLVMGQAGNRSEDEIRDLARTAAASRPDLILLKDEPGMLRGRAPGEVPALLRAALLEAGMAEDRIHILGDELQAAYTLMSWADSGDVAVLSVHGSETRPQLRAALDLAIAAQG
jgi:UDP-N-acetylmuramyl tripeptide synthase